MPVLSARLEGADHGLQLPFAADERRFEADGAPRAPGASDYAQRGPRADGLLATLDLVLAGVLVGDRRLARAAGYVVDEHRPGLGDRLQPRRGVDGVAEHHPLALGAQLDRRVAGQHAGADAQLGHPDLLAEQRDGLRERERRADRPFGVVLARDRSAPDGHHGIADELLDRAAVALDQRPATVEVAAQQIADLLGVAVL